MSKTALTLRTGATACIQTSARRRHGALVDELLASDDEPCETSARWVDLLAGFLNRADFAALRASSPALAGAVEAEVTLERDESCRDGPSPGFRLHVRELVGDRDR
jgi:hypothetical protein